MGSSMKLAYESSARISPTPSAKCGMRISDCGLVNRNNCLLLVRFTFKYRLGDAIIYSCKDDSCYMKPDRLISNSYMEIAVPCHQSPVPRQRRSGFLLRYPYVLYNGF